MNQPPKLIEEIRAILADVVYRDWQIVVGIKGGYTEGERDIYLQVQFEGACSVTGRVETQYCRKWKLSPYMTTSELVRTAFKAIEAAERHELEEHFKYKGRAIYNPHFDVAALVELCDQERYEVRS